MIDRPSTTHTPQSKHPLSGLQVVSMAEQYPGPFATTILSDLGADVIQIERPGVGDPARFLRPFYEAINRGKRSIALDITTPEGRDSAIDLIKQADVFLEGFRPGKLARQGLGYEALSAVNPALIYCSISGFGQTGPYRDRPAHDLTFQGLSGALNERITGDVTGRSPGVLLGDTTSALYATIGVLAAIEGRRKTGKGTHIDIALSDAVLATMGVFVASAEFSDIDPPPQAEPAYDLFQCADGLFLTLSIAHEDVYWTALCADLDLDDVATLSRAARVENRDVLRARIAAKIAKKPRLHWEAVFTASGQMWGPAHRLHEVADDPHVAARGMMERLTRADGVDQWVIRQPVKFSAYENAPLARAPELGEHQGEGFSNSSRIET